EDGIRDDLVTGVQTCALPILARPASLCLDAGPIFFPASERAHSLAVRFRDIDASKGPRMIAPLLEFINCLYFLLWCVPDFSVYTGGLLVAVFCHSSNGENFAAVRVTHGSRSATTKDENSRKSVV